MADEQRLLEYLKRATAEVKQLRKRLQVVESGEVEPIAVIGMGCRYPGGVTSPEELWQLVEDGRDVVTGAPPERAWDMPVVGGFLDHAAEFDAGFFGISPHEALATDPQQRLLHEVSWEALERAGLRPESLRGEPVGVFVGSNGQSYWELLRDNPELSGSANAAAAIMSGRLSYTYGWEGPSLTVDTACSSALVAIHLAAQSLRAGESSLALAGGVTIMSAPGVFVEFTRQGALSEDGRCRSFSDDADGTGWAEGVGVLVLERLSDARRNGHRVLGLVRGSAVNSDGASNGFAAPNGPSQQRVIRQALANARLGTGDVDLVDGHGTGTVLGDPIEVQALLATYGSRRPSDEPLWLGSLKSNIGHSQAAAGVGGVIKVIMAMRHGVLPRSLHAGAPTSKVDWTAGAVRLLDEARPWPKKDTPRRAGVSAFGVSGTNSHVIIEEPGDEPESRPSTVVSPWLISAKNPAGLRARARQLETVEGAGVAKALATTREAFDHRAALVTPDAETLRALAGGTEAPGLVRGIARRGKLAFVFSGQGAQRVGMGLGLAARYPVFAEAFDEIVDRCGVRAALSDQDLLDQTGNTQPALFAVEVALFRLVTSWGLRPDFLCGHSIGEIAAAHVSGMLSLDDACTLVSARARLMRELPAGGAMVAISAPESAVRPLLPGGVSIAAVNGPAAVVVSGDTDAVLDLVAKFGRTKRLPVSHAFHSARMEPMLDDFRAVVEGLSFTGPDIPVVPTASGTDMTGPGYWVDQVRDTVGFAGAVETLVASGVNSVLELGPGGLTPMVEDCAPGTIAVPALRRDREEETTIVTALARLHVHGVDVDWETYFGGTGPNPELPTYPFQPQHFWPRSSDLLGDPVPLADSGDVVFTGVLSTRRQPWLADHVVGGRVLVPGAAILEMAVHAADRLGFPGVRELILRAPLELVPDVPVTVQLRVQGSRELSLHAERDGVWTLHATGALAEESVDAGWSSGWPPEAAEPLDVSGVYERLAESGFAFGPAFRGLTALWSGEGVVYAEVELPQRERVDVDLFGLQPALLDAVLHAVPFTGVGEGEPVLPFLWNDVTVHARGAVAVHARLTRLSADAVSIDLTDIAGSPVASIGSLTLRAADTSAPQVSYVLDWPQITTAVSTGQDVLVTVPLGTAEELVTWTLGRLQEWLATDRSERLVFVTSGAVCAEPGGPVADPSSAAVWGLVRSAQTENPGRFVLVDTDDPDGVREALGTDEPQLAIRAGRVRAPRLARPATADRLVPPSADWRLSYTGGGTIDDLHMAAHPGADAALGEGQIRVAIRAVGLNFRDVVTVLGMYPGAEPGPVCGEAAGVVLEAGPGVSLRPGDRVTGLFLEGVGPTVITDHRTVAVFPDDWSFARAAAVPLVFLTAYFGFVDLSGLSAGESVLIHAGTGGVGMAAIQLARHLGAEIHATASPAKHAVLRELGVAADRIASSRTLDFEEHFRGVTGGRGMDVVLNALAAEFADASLRLLVPGGRFVEMGKTDLRGEQDLPGVRYRSFDLLDAGADRIQEMLAELMALFRAGTLTPLPILAWDVRDARDAFRFMSHAKHTGKLVLTLPRAVDPNGTVLITGGTGALGRALARHLTGRGLRVLLLSRTGTAEGHVVNADVADPDALRRVLAAIPAEHPLTMVVHAAGVLDDGVISAQTPQRLASVLRPKVDGAAHLHELVGDIDAFVVYSSTAGTVGGPGQGGYAAANAYLDALMTRRRAAGLAGTSLAWGPFDAGEGMTSGLGEAHLQRLARSGFPPLSIEAGLGLFDRLITEAAAVAYPLRLDLAAIRGGEEIPHLLRGLVERAAPKPAAPTAKVVRSGASTLDLIRAQAALVLGHASVSAIGPDRPFQELGFDSLSAVELRNRLEKVTGAALSATVIFDYPTPAALADHLGAEPVVPERATPVTKSTEDDPVVIVGMSCRYPGGVRNPDDLWELLADGRDAVSGFPADRGWDIAAVHDPSRVRPGTSYTGEGGFLDHATEFDAEFFGISPREALAMDPQHRLLLETSWAAFESAGIDPTSLRGSATGVFAGLILNDYASLEFPESVPGNFGTGVAGSVASGRLAYLLGLEGPAVTVDTACSSSLVAMHLAAQSLRTGECDLAVAGGATVLCTPVSFVEFSRQGVLSPDGRSRSFAEGANGAGWAEGAGVVVLERLSDARRLGHEVMAVLRGSAVNSDGASNGLTAPNGLAQQRVIRTALAQAGLRPSDVDAVEAHGTGTTLGDPIEAGAVLATYGQDRDRPLWLGSVKSNLGHTQAAAGVAGVIKMVLAMRHGVLPKTLHADIPSPHVDWESGAVSLLTEARRWPEPRRAGVSSFGISGTNAHIVLEQGTVSPVPGASGKPLPLLLSAKSDAALREQAGLLSAALNDDLAGAAGTLALSRARFDHRAVIVPADLAGARAALDALAAGELTRDTVVGTAIADTQAVFVFPGQGSQWVGMARELWDSSPVFAEHMAECALALSSQVDWRLTDVLGDEEALSRVDIVQPALWAVMVSLAGLWRSSGVEPAAVAGHSQGEIAAACVAGALSLADGALIVTARSRAIANTLAGRGGMVAVATSREQTEHLMSRCSGRISLAAVNGPTATVVSGGTTALDEFLAVCETGGVQARRVDVDYASHSSQVDLIEDHLLDVLSTLTPAGGDIPFHSSVTGELFDTAGLDAAYWVRNLRETVRFGTVTRNLIGEGLSTFVEVSPHPVLVGALSDTDPAVRVTGTLRRDAGGMDRFRLSLGQAHAYGLPVDWAPVFEGTRRIPLPTYPFQRRRFWPEPAATGLGRSRHPVLGTVVELPETGGRLFSGRIHAHDASLATPHDLAGFAASTYARGVTELDVERPLGTGAVQLVVDAARAFTIWSSPGEDGPWIRHATGRLGEPSEPAPVLPLYRVEWVDVPAAAGPVRAEVFDARTESGPAGLRAAVAEVLAKLQDWLTGEGLLVVVTGEDLVSSAISGLVRSARTEHPDRFVHVDLDVPALDPRTLATVAHCGEPELRVRRGRVQAPRLAELDVVGERWRPGGTVLITGGTGGLGRELARHLVGQGVRKLVLASRSGPDADGIGEFVAGLDADVVVRSADVSVREDVERLLAGIDDLTAVIHTAGHTADGVLASMTPQRLDEVLRPKADAAWHLHELTKHLPLTAFVLFSSFSGLMGSGGQANYAAANAFLDGLARYRRELGLPATSLAWGLWSTEVGMAARLDATAISRMAASGVGTLGVAEGLALFDAALATGEATVVPVRLDSRVIRATEAIPALFQGLVPPVRREAEEIDPAGVLAVVRRTVAAVLGHAAGDEIRADRAFRELGFDSLTAVDLRNRLNARTGLDLPTTVVFDYPTATALADYIAGRIAGTRPATATPVTRSTVDDPIVIIGMACRFPGGVRTPDELWDLLESQVSAIGEFPGDRGWDLDALYDPTRTKPGTTYSLAGGFLDEAADFDPGFFGISPREALATDPQQRMVLETSWEALELAGIDATSLRGSATGVFVGATPEGYVVDALSPAVDQVRGHLMTGNTMSVMSGRVAYELGLEGPAVTVDTACSSGLVATHWAIQALRSGECSLALAGAVTVMSQPHVYVEFSTQGASSPDGKCRPFAEGAEGTVLSEGAAMLVLERLSDARRNGHQVLAVVRGSALNSDGASNGISAPNGPSQERVIRQALASAGLTPADIDAVESHGTGTALGDPIEAQALLNTYGQDRERPLLLGALKANIGHTQSVSGVAGVVKMVLAMRHGVLPGMPGFGGLTSKVDWSTGEVEVVSERTPWPVTGAPRRSAVSAFGISGTNAHIVLEAFPESTVESPHRDDVVPWVLSARSSDALRAQATKLAGALGDRNVADIGSALVTTRARFEHRAVVLGRDHADFLTGLAAIGDTEPAGPAEPLAVQFTGQGSQRAGMGRELYERFPVFADAFDDVLVRLGEHGLRELIFTDQAKLDQTGYAQPALFALEVALYRLIESWGLRPAYLIGHSIGEIAAAHVAGVLDLADACTLVAARAALMQALPAGGAMVSLRAGETEIVPLLTERVSIAAVNGPRSVVIAGDEDAVADVVARFGGKAKRLPVSHAFHSPRMDPMLAEFRTAITGLTYHPPAIPILTEGDVTDPEYWVGQVRNPVRFADALGRLSGHGVRTVLELGPDGVLSALAGETLGQATLLPALRKDRPEVETLLETVGKLHVRGFDVDWAPLFPGARPAPLPTYAFQRERFWLGATNSVADLVSLGMTGADHPLLGAVVELPDATVLTGLLSVRTQSWLAEHEHLPGTAFLDLVAFAGRLTGKPRVRELTITSPLPVRETGLRVSAQADDTVTVHARAEDGTWVLHATGSVEPGAAAVRPGGWPPVDAERVEDSVLGDWETEHGPSLRRLTSAWRRDGVLFAEVALTGQDQPADYGLHPALLEPVLLAASGKVPAAWEGVEIHRTGATALRVTVTPLDTGGVRVEATDADGNPVASAESVTLQEPSNTNSLFHLDWVPVAAEPLGEQVVLTAMSEDNSPEAVHALTARVLGELRHRLSEQDTQLVVVTRLAAPDSSVRDLAGAAVWGLVRSAQTENPDRITLVDLDTTDLASVRISGAEPQLVVRGGEVFAPRLERTTENGPKVRLGARVLVTGGTGGLGLMLTRHLVLEHGVREVVLTSRGGGDPDAVDKLRQELPQAELIVERCDMSDREAVAKLLIDHPPTAVVHTAGVVDDGVVGALTPDRLSAVLRPKADAAWHLHELTRDLPLTAFVLYSSASGLLGGSGQANYAAANTYLDALAALRRSTGLPATSIAWGAWESGSGMTGKLSDAQIRRMAQSGVQPLSARQGLAMFDAALSTGNAVQAAVRLDLAAMRQLGDRAPALVRALIPARTGRSVTRNISLAQRFDGVPESEHLPALAGLVREQVAAVLRHSDARGVPVDRPFSDLGLDSLTAVELRNGLRALSGVTLSTVAAFDHPTVTELAAHLYERWRAETVEDTVGDKALRDLDEFERSFASAGDRTREELVTRLRALLPAAAAPLPEADDELFALIDDLDK
jgi:acyl transferase domain-containing protein/NADPH:quinone reductase-like Zn-dependent oxidoreductase/acyl carrier protein